MNVTCNSADQRYYAIRDDKQMAHVAMITNPRVEHFHATTPQSTHFFRLRAHTCQYTYTLRIEGAAYFGALLRICVLLRYAVSFWGQVWAFYIAPLMLCIAHFIVEVVSYCVLRIIQQIRSFILG